MKLLGLLLPLLLAGCHEPDSPASRTGAAPPVPAAVRPLVIQRGKAIAAETFSLLSSNLQAAIQSGGVSNALPFCALAASPLTAGMAQKHGVTLRRVTHKPRNPTARADGSELAVLDGFQSALGKTNTPPPVVTNLRGGVATFFAPIVLNHELCLRCHGQPGADILAPDLAIIQRLYPADEATGFQLGQLRGAWRIDFPLASLAAATQPVAP